MTTNLWLLKDKRNLSINSDVIMTEICKTYVETYKFGIYSYMIANHLPRLFCLHNPTKDFIHWSNHRASLTLFSLVWKVQISVSSARHLITRGRTIHIPICNLKGRRNSHWDSFFQTGATFWNRLHNLFKYGINNYLSSILILYNTLVH